MASPTTKKRSSSGPSPTCLFILVACVLLPFEAHASPVENHTSTTIPDSTLATVPTTAVDDEPNYEQVLRDAVTRLFTSMPSSLRRKLLEAEVRPECSVGLLRLMRGFQSLEPWALKLFDASGKYPSGLLQATKADLGAFDECLETVVHDNYGLEVSRGQYCSVLFHLKENRALKKRISSLDVLHPLIKQYTDYFFIDEVPVTRLGVCITNDCNKQDLQAIINAGKPKPLRIEVESCTTIDDVVMTPGQIAIIAFLAVISILIGAGTVVEIYVASRKKTEKSSQSAWLKYVTSFSALHNSRAIFTVKRQKNAGDFDLRFIHGLRFFSLVSIVLGHSYGIMSDVWSRTLNLLILTEYYMSIFVTAGFVLVDTFFFISGFLMCLVIDKQHTNGLRVFVFALIRRLVRKYLLMTICCWASTLWGDQEWQATSLATTHGLQKKYFRESVDWFPDIQQAAPEPPDWLSRPQAFGDRSVCLSRARGVLHFCLASHSMGYRPFHGVSCSQAGMVQITCWAFSLAAGLCCLFIKSVWYSGDAPTSDLGKIALAFFDRIMWSIFIGWITLACISGRGGFVSKFLSWAPFAPLSRLSFAVYLIHFPFIEIMLHSSRERLYYSHFNQVTLFFSVLMWSYTLAYFMYLVCEGPTANLDKLFFGSTTRPQVENAASVKAQKGSNLTQEVVFEIPRIVLENDEKPATGTQ
ncbi:hypothetical protein HPB51_019088 [Rhipicephalus microplus]|uniref:Nose resistant-to-fluoxetine protein N-terminal domain-containing protein n=1 Tax=Rhipicephalus microplus TaxID=6941 RepID=A0A9J6EID8_RHIMP|nr:hypothetical protein HPB51_019088 [Rhipicephalus microplus]